MSRVQLSKHFYRDEMECKCGKCGFDTIDVETLALCEIIRSKFGAFTPNSAARCSSHNRNIGGGSHSQHLFGRAVDVPTGNPKALFDFLDNLYPDTYGLGLYSNSGFVHVDTRSKKARWRDDV